MSHKSSRAPLPIALRVAPASASASATPSSSHRKPKSLRTLSARKTRVSSSVPVTTGTGAPLRDRTNLPDEDAATKQRQQAKQVAFSSRKIDVLASTMRRDAKHPSSHSSSRDPSRSRSRSRSPRARRAALDATLRQRVLDARAAEEEQIARAMSSAAEVEAASARRRLASLARSRSPSLDSRPPFRPTSPSSSGPGASGSSGALQFRSRDSFPMYSSAALAHGENVAQVSEPSPSPYAAEHAAREARRAEKERLIRSGIFPPKLAWSSSSAVEPLPLTSEPMRRSVSRKTRRPTTSALARDREYSPPTRQGAAHSKADGSGGSAQPPSSPPVPAVAARLRREQAHHSLVPRTAAAPIPPPPPPAEPVSAPRAASAVRPQSAAVPFSSSVPRPTASVHPSSAAARSSSAAVAPVHPSRSRRGSVSSSSSSSTSDLASLRFSSSSRALLPHEKLRAEKAERLHRLREQLRTLRSEVAHEESLCAAEQEALRSVSASWHAARNQLQSLTTRARALESEGLRAQETNRAEVLTFQERLVKMLARSAESLASAQDQSTQQAAARKQDAARELQAELDELATMESESQRRLSEMDTQIAAIQSRRAEALSTLAEELALERTLRTHQLDKSFSAREAQLRSEAQSRLTSAGRQQDRLVASLAAQHAQGLESAKQHAETALQAQQQQLSFLKQQLASKRAAHTALERRIAEKTEEASTRAARLQQLQEEDVRLNLELDSAVSQREELQETHASVLLLEDRIRSWGGYVRAMEESMARSSVGLGSLHAAFEDLLARVRSKNEQLRAGVRQRAAMQLAALQAQEAEHQAQERAQAQTIAETLARLQDDALPPQHAKPSAYAAAEAHSSAVQDQPPAPTVNAHPSAPSARSDSSYTTYTSPRSDDRSAREGLSREDERNWSARDERSYRSEYSNARSPRLSRSRSPSRSRSASRSRSRSRSPYSPRRRVARDSRSASRSPAPYHSRSRSLSRDRSYSRSRTPSPAYSRDASRSRSHSRSQSRSPQARSRYSSPSHSRSHSRSPSRSPPRVPPLALPHSTQASHAQTHMTHADQGPDEDSYASESIEIEEEAEEEEGEFNDAYVDDSFARLDEEARMEAGTQE